jgi:hypothetical protein
MESLIAAAAASGALSACGIDGSIPSPRRLAEFR